MAWPLVVVALGELWIAQWLPSWIGWAPAWAGLATLYVSAAYLAKRPDWLGKTHPLRFALLPYLIFSRAIATLAQRMGLIERQEIVPGLWVGGWPRHGAPGLAQLDLTAELPRRGSALAYATVPMLDGAAPRPEAWREAVARALSWRRSGLPVLVHCAYGHGRSVAVVIGVLVAEGHATDTKAALAIVTAIRPRARMTPGQRRLVAAELLRAPFA